MKQIFLIDSIEKLNIKKDSSLMMALTYKQLKGESYLMFLEDLYFSNISEDLKFKVYKFDGDFIKDSYYIKDFKISDEMEIIFTRDDILHMRIDPPFNIKYLRTLWVLKALNRMTGVKVVNDPVGIMSNNEKLEAFILKNSIDSFVGSCWNRCKSFIDNIKRNDSIIVKPIDLFQGIGVQKILKTDFTQERFEKIVDKYEGNIIVQPYISDVEKGEIRTVFYKGMEIGTILKTPKEGEFLANIAMGAQFEKFDLSRELQEFSKKIANQFSVQGVDLIAFDILGGQISEINITCPGLLVEVSTAMKKNLAEIILKS